MPSTVLVNGLGLTYKSTLGISMATIPDVCKTPSPGGPVPIPYPNIADQSTLKNGTTTVTCEGQMIAIKGSEYGMSSGDEPGTIGGVTSNTFKKETEWITYSFDVILDGANACRHTDKKFHNHKNTVDLAGNVDPTPPVASTEHDIKCAIQKCDNAPYDISTTQEGKPMPANSRCGALGSKKHKCVADALKPPCQSEQTFDMTKNPPNPVPVSPGKGLGRRPDVVIGGPPTASYDVFDAKFPCSSGVKGGATTGVMPSAPVTGANYVKPNSKELRDYKAIANGGKSKALTPEDCKAEVCDG